TIAAGSAAAAVVGDANVGAFTLVGEVVAAVDSCCGPIVGVGTPRDATMVASVAAVIGVGSARPATFATGAAGDRASGVAIGAATSVAAVASVAAGAA